MYKSWLSFSGPKRQIIFLAIATGLIFVLITLTKGIFEVIAQLFMIPFSLSILLTQNRKLILNAFGYVVIVLAIFYLFISGYKLANKILNGNFVVTNRGPIMLYGSVARRAEPLTRERFLTALAYIPGEGVCRDIFGEEKCSFSPLRNQMNWLTRNSMHYERLVCRLKRRTESLFGSPLKKHCRIRESLSYFGLSKV